MQVFAGLMALVFVASAVALGLQWQQTRADIESAEVTVTGFKSLIEVLYGYRLDHPTQWPSDISELSQYVAPGSIQTATSVGINGEGSRYEMNIVGQNIELSTQLQSDTTSLRVLQTLGTQATRTALGSGYEIRLTVPPPGGVNLLLNSLLIDGSNKLDRPLWFSQPETVGEACVGRGIAVDSVGDLLRCGSGQWQSI